MRRMHSQPDPRAVRAWVLYDVGNSAFATTVMAGFFPVFFKQYWSAGDDPTDTIASATAWLETDR